MIIFLILFTIQGFSKDDILLITLDTTRKDYINEKTAPFLYNFSKESFNFENCRTPVPLTLPAHTTILTGLYPKNHKVRNNSSYKLDNKIKTIQEILKENGYFTSGFVSSFVLNKSYNLNKGFDIYDDEMTENYEKKDFEMEERGARETAERAINFLRNYKKKPLFLWVHFFDPHYPYIEHKEAPSNFSNYEKEIYYMDLYVKKIIEEFLKERTGLIIIAADHGESLGEHKEETHGVFLYDSVLRVPFIIKNTKEKKGRVFDEQVSLIDIFPTILDFLRIPLPKNIDGKSLFSKIEKRNLFFETYLPSESFGWATPFGIFDGRFKFIFLPEKEIYDLIPDPNEEKNLIEEKKEKARELYNILKRDYSVKYEEKFSKDMSLEELKKLESLGYLSGSKPSQKDPKDLIWVVKALEEGKKLSEEKKYREAEKIFLKILKENPENYPALIQYGTILREEKKLDDALEIFKKAKIINPFYIHSKFNLGTILFEKNKMDEAEKEFLEIIKILPSFSEPYFYLVKIFLQKKDINKAKEVLENARKNLKKEANLYFYEGLVFAESFNYQKAVENFNEALKLSPDYLDARFNLAQAYYNLGKVDDALRNFEIALKLNPDFPELYLIIGSIYLNDKEDLGKSKKYFQEFLERFPDHPEKENVKEILISIQ